MKLDERTLYVLTRLNSPEFKAYIEYLDAYWHETVKTLVTATDPEYKARLSGKAALLQEMKDNVEKSADILKKLQRKGP